MAAEVFTVQIESNITEKLAADSKALIQAARKVVAGRGKRVAKAISSEIRRAGLRERLASAIKHSSRDIADGVEAVIASKAISKAYADEGGGGRHEDVDLAALLQAELVVTPTVKNLLAIPLPAAGRGPRGRAARVSDFPFGSLRALFRNGRGILVSKDNPTVPLFVLTPRTRRAKFLSSSKSWEKYATEGLAERILAEWARHRVTIALKRIA